MDALSLAAAGAVADGWLDPPDFDLLPPLPAAVWGDVSTEATSEAWPEALSATLPGSGWSLRLRLGRSDGGAALATAVAAAAVTVVVGAVPGRGGAVGKINDLAVEAFPAAVAELVLAVRYFAGAEFAPPLPAAPISKLLLFLICPEPAEAIMLTALSARLGAMWVCAMSRLLSPNRDLCWLKSIGARILKISAGNSL